MKPFDLKATRELLRIMREGPDWATIDAARQVPEALRAAVDHIDELQAENDGLRRGWKVLSASMNNGWSVVSALAKQLLLLEKRFLPKFVDPVSVEDGAQLSLLVLTLRSALLDAEWAGVDWDEGWCGSQCQGCDRKHRDREEDRRFFYGDADFHASGCLIDFALTVAGLPDQASRDAERDRERFRREHTLEPGASE